MNNKFLSLIVILNMAVLGMTTNSNGQKKTYEIDSDNSQVKWTGYHIAKSYEHIGEIKIESGSLVLEKGTLVSGNITIDMNSITNSDLEDTKDNEKLVKDLKSKRFFNAKEFPKSYLNFSEVQKKNEGYEIKGQLVIRGITKDIRFEAKQSKKSGESLEFVASLSIDRTEFDVMYGWSVENVILSNTFDLEVKIVASP